MPVKYVQKGWGYELWIVNKPEYCGKLLFFEKDKRCSWHYHQEKDETFFLQSGKLLVNYLPIVFDRVDGYLTGITDIEKAETMLLTPNMSLHIPPYTCHQMIALEDSELFEVSTQHFEYDSIRIQAGD